MHKNLSELGLSYIHKLSVFRLAVDLIKADNQIFCEEIDILTDLQQQFGLSQEDVDGIHYITLQQSVEALKDLDVEAGEKIVALLSDIMCVDNDIDYDENILLTSIKMSIAHKTRSWCNVISAVNVMDETSRKQIMYLEDAPSEAAHKVFGDKYDRLLITKAFNDLGLDFFYLPDAISGLNAADSFGSKSNTELLKQAMRYLVPSAVVSPQTSERKFDPYDFYYFLLSRYNINPDALSSHSFLMLKIRDSYYLDDEHNLVRSVDFLVIDVAEDVKKRIYAFVSNFDRKSSQISYVGCYKILCDYLSSDSRNVSHVVLDSKYDFFLKDTGRTPLAFESSPQSRSFYLLLLWYGDKGIPQSLFEEAVRFLDQVDKTDYVCGKTGQFQMDRFVAMLFEEDMPVCRLIYRAIAIYSVVSTKEVENIKFIDYIKKIFRYRSALKYYINKGFTDIERLTDLSAFYIVFDAQTKTYRLPVNVARFVVEAPDRSVVQLSSSDLWQKLM